MQLQYQSMHINLMHNQAYCKLVIQNKRKILLVGCTRACLERDRGYRMPRLVLAPLTARVPSPRAPVRASMVTARWRERFGAAELDYGEGLTVADGGPTLF
jgi:hypothetical protein